jgi:hypothetical protein
MPVEQDAEDEFIDALVPMMQTNYDLEGAAVDFRPWVDQTPITLNPNLDAQTVVFLVRRATF